MFPLVKANQSSPVCLLTLMGHVFGEGGLVRIDKCPNLHVMLLNGSEFSIWLVFQNAELF